MKIPVVFISDDNFVMQTSVAITSLQQHRKKDTSYDIYVVMAECGEGARSILESIKGVTLIEASLAEYKNIIQMAHISIACLLKFDICELIPEQEKLLYLDGDIIVREDLTDLYRTEIGNYYAAAVVPVAKMSSGLINAGIMLFNAKKMREDKMREKLVKKRRSLGNRPSMDQQTFNLLMGDKILHLPVRYNCIPVQVKEAYESLNIETLQQKFHCNYQNMEEFFSDAAIYHYATAQKPWFYLQTPCGEEWYQNYLSSPFGEKTLKRYTKWGARYFKLKREIRKEGLPGMYRFLKAALQKRTQQAIQQKWG